MANQRLELMYHPARKAVEIHRFQGDTPIIIEQTSKLADYMRKSGKFILQDQGNKFLSDIVSCFDGEKSVYIDVITTKRDYEDFEQMVEYYNTECPGKEIKINLLSELPDMEETFRVVKEHGDESKAILGKHKAKFHDVLRGNSPKEVVDCVNSFVAEAQKEIDSVNEKIASMEDSNVNLCFAGVYSAGKSALINAIIGYKILPEAIKSETARMFRIQSPKKDEPIRIVFSIRAAHSEIIWSNQNNRFDFVTGPVENPTREEIQNVINDKTGAARHEQIFEILRTLNTLNDISPEISIYFPIPLDNNRVQFTIFDTPGTDSNYLEHQSILSDALSSQTHSILIFVAAPNKLEGEGNNTLLTMLSKEEKSVKNSIDIGRSLFVINYADDINIESRQSLQGSEIKSKNDQNISIKLSDKKLFFTSAKQAYAAAAVRNGIANAEDNAIIDEDLKQIIGIRGKYYQQNHCALSEIATKNLIDKSNKALEKAVTENNTVEVFHIASGVYALENEIVVYGEKYASATRAYAIIDSVDKALANMNLNANSLKSNNQKNIAEINEEIEQLHTKITQAIEKVSKEKDLQPNKPLDKNILLDLHLDASYINSNIVSKAKESVGQRLHKWFLGIAGKVKVKPNQQVEISSAVTTVLNDYTKNFIQTSKKLLEKQRDDFRNAVSDVIKNNGGISNEAKEYVLNINVKEVSMPSLKNLIDLYEEKITKSAFLKHDVIDKDEYLSDFEDQLGAIVRKLSTDFETKYRDTHKSTLNAVTAEFENNLKKYSLRLKAKLEDKEAIENLGNKIQDAANELKICQNELWRIIWRVKDANR